MIGRTSSVGEIYTVVGWVIISLGILTGGIILATSNFMLMLMGGGVIIGGIIAGMPFLAIGAILERLALTNNLQRRGNELTEALLEAITSPQQSPDQSSGQNRKMPTTW